MPNFDSVEILALNRPLGRTIHQLEKADD